MNSIRRKKNNQLLNTTNPTNQCNSLLILYLAAFEFRSNLVQEHIPPQLKKDGVAAGISLDLDLASGRVVTGVPRLNGADEM